MTSRAQFAPDWPRWLGTIVLLLVIVAGLNLMFSPWKFFIGGRFTPFMTWHGYGQFGEGADSYSVFVDLGDSPVGDSSDSTSDLLGTALVCGVNRSIEEWQARLETAPIWLNTDGAKTNLHMTRSAGRYPDGVERFDIVDLPGVWRGPRIALRDDGKFAALAGSHPAASPRAATVSYGSLEEFEAACRAGRNLPNAR